MENNNKSNNKYPNTSFSNMKITITKQHKKNTQNFVAMEELPEHV